MSQLVRMLILSILVISLSGQDLNSAWQAYMSTSASIAELEAERTVYTREQIAIKNEVDQLQKSSTWYNAWLNKYILSNHSQRQLVILDLVRTIDVDLERLQSIQEGEIGRLKLAYEEVLEDYENAGIIPADQDLKDMQVDRFRRVIRPNPILFPDYTEILGIDWHNPEQRRLLLLDVYRLLQTKIVELDSIQTVREKEAELAIRLADFHEDLGLQMASEQDAQQRDASGESEKALGWFTADATANEYAQDGDRENLASSLTSESIDVININVPRADVREMSLDQRSGKDLNYLKTKITQYKTLLEAVDQELNQSP